MKRQARDAMLRWLREEDESRLEDLFASADEVRRGSVGDAVHLRGLVEVSNHCRRGCLYCGLRAPNAALPRYRMTAEQVLSCARLASRLSYGTVVIQAGEDPGIGAEWVADLVRQIKKETGLAVTLSLGEREPHELARWREAGADRYLLRFETSDSELFAHIHPSLPGRKSDRVALLRELKRLGYEVGSGVMVGVPGQSYESLAADIELFQSLDLDMIGVGPYLPHPETPLAKERSRLPEKEQVPNTPFMALKVLALARIACPEANMPATTALATADPVRGIERGLGAGANVLMPNVAPPEIRAKYEVYPNKAVADATVPESAGRIRERIERIGRTVAAGPGGRRRAA
ncbi:MAG: [FeFe] hydrogenase H-cluster radical SAM maturase HydE [Myxococcales bacterium]|jgi:biotin synthase